MQQSLCDSSEGNYTEEEEEEPSKAKGRLKMGMLTSGKGGHSHMGQCCTGDRYCETIGMTIGYTRCP